MPTSNRRQKERRKVECRKPKIGVTIRHDDNDTTLPKRIRRYVKQEKAKDSSSKGA